MRERPSSRLLVVDAARRVLLFEFVTGDRRFWATPGGAVDEGESFAAAAIRELREETGIVADAGREVARREAMFTTSDGEPVHSDERYFLVRVDAPDLDTAGWTDDERRDIGSWYWWTEAELRTTRSTVFPENLPAMLAGAGIWSAAAHPL